MKKFKKIVAGFLVLSTLATAGFSSLVVFADSENPAPMESQEMSPSPEPTVEQKEPTGATISGTNSKRAVISGTSGKHTAFGRNGCGNESASEF